MNILERLKERGLIEQVTPELSEAVKKPIGLYLGVDPTADSIHLGNLVPMMVLAWFQKAGHRAYLIMGGATGMIGDPSGRSSERNLLSEEEIDKNLASISHISRSLAGFSRVTVLNNNDWLGDWNLIEFLRDVGKEFRLSTMLAKDSVKTRLESEEGMSFTEFTYQILQGYDFYHLHKTHDVTLQVGGSDQWGNITAGIEFNRKMKEKQIHGLTVPLLTRSDGKKFGKTAEGAVWLSAHRTSPYQLYQYLLGIPDADVIRLLKVFTFLEIEEIYAIEKQMKTEANVAQRRLAEEVTRFAHGEEGIASALQLSKGFAPGSEAKLSRAALEELAKELKAQDPDLYIELKKEEVVGQKISDLFAKIGLASSKSEALRLIQNGGGYVNNEKIDQATRLVSKEDLVDGHYLLLSAGKKRKKLIRICFEK